MNLLGQKSLTREEENTDIEPHFRTHKIIKESSSAVVDYYFHFTAWHKELRQQLLLFCSWTTPLYTIKQSRNHLGLVEYQISYTKHRPLLSHSQGLHSNFVIWLSLVTLWLFISTHPEDTEAALLLLTQVFFYSQPCTGRFWPVPQRVLWHRLAHTPGSLFASWLLACKPRKRDLHQKKSLVKPPSALQRALAQGYTLLLFTGNH